MRRWQRRHAWSPACTRQKAATRQTAWPGSVAGLQERGGIDTVGRDAPRPRSGRTRGTNPRHDPMHMYRHQLHRAARSLDGSMPHAATQARQAARQGNGTTDAHRWSESGMAIHGEHRKTNPGERRRSGGPCPIGVHRCASVVPNSCLVASRSWQPEGLVIPTSRTPCTNSRRAADTSAERRIPCTRSSRPAGAAHRLARSAHETMARLVRDRSVRYFI